MTRIHDMFSYLCRRVLQDSRYGRHRGHRVWYADDAPSYCQTCHTWFLLEEL